MRRAWAAAALLPVLALAAADKAAIPARSGPLEVHPLRAVPLINGGFENAARPGERCAEKWDCTMHGNPQSFAFQLQGADVAEGRQALCIQRMLKEPWALATTTLQAAELRGLRLRFSVAVRTDGAEGTRVGPAIIVHGPHYVLGHGEKLTGKTAGWERHAVEVTVAPNALVIEMGVQMQEGGRACVDDARLEVMP